MQLCNAKNHAQEATVSDLEMLRTAAATFMVAKAQVLGPTRDARGSLQRTLNMVNRTKQAIAERRENAAIGRMIRRELVTLETESINRGLLSPKWRDEFELT